MAGLRQGAGNVTTAQLQGSVSVLDVAVPGNAKVGDLVLVFHMTGTNTAGTRVFTATSPGGAWTRLFTLQASAGVDAGAVFVKQITAADLGANVRTAYTSTIARWTATAVITEGFTLDQMLAMTMVQTSSNSTTPSAVLPAAATSATSTVLHFLAVHAANATGPFVTPVTGGTGTTVAYIDVPPQAALAGTATWLEQAPDVAGTAGAPAVTVTFPGPLTRMSRHTLVVPFTARAGAGTASGAATAIGTGGTARSGSRSATSSAAATGVGTTKRTGARTAAVAASVTGLGATHRAGTYNAQATATATAMGTTRRAGVSSAVATLGVTSAGSAQRQGQSAAVVSLAASGLGLTTRLGEATAAAVLTATAVGGRTRTTRDLTLNVVLVTGSWSTTLQQTGMAAALSPRRIEASMS